MPDIYQGPKLGSSAHQAALAFGQSEQSKPPGGGGGGDSSRVMPSHLEMRDLLPGGWRAAHDPPAHRQELEVGLAARPRPPALHATLSLVSLEQLRAVLAISAKGKGGKSGLSAPPPWLGEVPLPVLGEVPELPACPARCNRRQMGKQVIRQPVWLCSVGRLGCQAGPNNWWAWGPPRPYLAMGGMP